MKLNKYEVGSGLPPECINLLANSACSALSPRPKEGTEQSKSLPKVIIN
jgi:hypothetical protein